ncbi:hypothetical protein ACQRD4_09415 [Streptococcus hyointestinalis]|uniref:Uncharacterized protein n=1 Tax=Streptococcus hyointestinalis TaxID=1337 RepID=A0A380K6I7_9STRE|nr:hypothetical protein [Streptococcus hyointestinalis]MCI6871087.1 hypothetical protein [Streptococcus hyointestinalis]MDD6384900.1 hypothetical protein [Streptococcus hyointestinalis]MDD7355652.1 hypothetical protein [Streptococcus hyointestinalis]MDY4553835.1 hypothetical protein [Streptococcus hyointestinalis]SUN60692.1 Uncharacterised protein [Streptococcus hyointestinalis]
MTIEHLKEDLTSLQIPKGMIEQIVALEDQGNSDMSKQQLLRARGELLNQLHQAQDRLYRLDVIIHNLHS